MPARTGVENDVAHEFQQVRLPLDQNALVATWNR